jgi:hypothetical protein
MLAKSMIAFTLKYLDGIVYSIIELLAAYLDGWTGADSFLGP